MKKKVLVIGAGLAQVDAIVRAKELGYFVLASDGSPHAPGLPIAHESCVLDVKDVAGNLAWAEESKVDGVISYASDITLPTVLEIRERLKLPGLSRHPMEVSLDKSLQRTIFEQAGLAQPKFKIIQHPEELHTAAQSLNWPIVIKPVDNSGSRGVAVVKNKNELESLYQTAYRQSKKGLVLIEEFMEGTELTVEGFSVKGQHHILAISDKFKPEGPYRVATQLAFPANISSEMKQAVKDLMTQAYQAMGVDNAPTHSEVIMTQDGPKIVETACRGGGFYLFTRVVPSASGYDLMANWTRLCLGDPVEPVTCYERGVVLRFFVASPGRLKKVSGMDEALKLPDVEGGLFIKPGEIVPELQTDGSRTGWLISHGADRQVSVNLADQVFQMVHFEVEPI
ncbi:ATP-grasp domain-containing protein [Deltaproteobacteria bacterium TL4]